MKSRSNCVAGSLPHMLPTAEAFAAAMDAMGVSHEDQVVVYDGSGLFSAARAWWMFQVPTLPLPPHTRHLQYDENLSLRTMKYRPNVKRVCSGGRLWVDACREASPGEAPRTAAARKCRI
jgi:hypothetical protein